MTIFAHRDLIMSLAGCGGCLSLFIPMIVVILAWIQSRPAPYVAWVFAGVGTAIVAVFLATIWRSMVRVRNYQRARNELAKVICGEVMEGKNPARPYFVYLRPFDMDGAFVQAPRSAPDIAYIEKYGMPTSQHDLESALALLVYPFGELVALGDNPSPAFDSGAARLRSTEETWQAEILRLCEHAEGVFVVPFDRKGTAWEIEMLVTNDWLNKSFFVMPAKPALGLGSKRLDYQALWEAGRAKYKVLTLPPYNRYGGIVEVGDRKHYHEGFGARKRMADLFDRAGERRAKRAKDDGDLEKLRSRLAELVASNDSAVDGHGEPA